MISLVYPAEAEDGPEALYSIQYEFCQQLVVDLAIDTLQELSSPLSMPSAFDVLREKLRDIRLELSAMASPEAADDENTVILMARLDHLDEIIRFNQLPADKKNAGSELKTSQYIDELLVYLRKQPNIAGFLTDKNLLDLTESRDVKFGGSWELTDTVRGGPFDGLEISFQIRIKKNHATLEASGEKFQENDVEVSARHRSPLKIYGYIKNNVIRAAFSEQGLRKESSGEFVWLVLNDKFLSGVFRSSTGASGDSILVKVIEELSDNEL